MLLLLHRRPILRSFRKFLTPACTCVAVQPHTWERSVRVAAQCHPERSEGSRSFATLRMTKGGARDERVHDAIISASRGSSQYGRYIGDIVGRLETKRGRSSAIDARAAPVPARITVLRPGAAGRSRPRPCPRSSRRGSTCRFFPCRLRASPTVPSSSAS